MSALGRKVTLASPRARPRVKACKKAGLAFEEGSWTAFPFDIRRDSDTPSGPLFPTILLKLGPCRSVDVLAHAAPLAPEFAAIFYAAEPKGRHIPRLCPFDKIANDAR